MLTLSIVEVDVLERAADAILLPFDGALPPGAGDALIDRSLGRIARAFCRRYPDCDLVEEIEAQVTFPVPPGRAAAVELEGCPFRHALLLSTLAHDPAHTSEAALAASLTGALADAVRKCEALQLETAAMPLLTGGWRLSRQTAGDLVLRTLAGAHLRHRLAISICLLGDPATAAVLRDLARTLQLTS